MGEEAVNLFFQRFSGGFTDALNMAVTLLGDETFFILVALVVFWCVNKTFGYKLINVYLAGTILRTGLSVIVARPRPFQAGEVRCIGEPTAGYSFPSGHSHSVANLSTQISLKTKKKWVIGVCTAVSLAVMMSRIYLGQHYLSDVLAGAALGVIFALGLSYLYDKLGDKEERIAFVAVPLFTVVAIASALCSVTSTALYDVCGAYAALTLGYYLEKKYISFSAEGKPWQQICKLLVGAAVVFGIKEGVKALFAAMSWTNPLLYNFLRYALLAFFASFVVPWLFVNFKLSKKQDFKENNNK